LNLVCRSCGGVGVGFLDHEPVCGQCAQAVAIAAAGSSEASIAFRRMLARIEDDVRFFQVARGLARLGGCRQ
jgi:hypothetical protein